MKILWQDVRYGARMLLKHPGFTVVAVLALALGIGANTAIFSVVNAVLLRALPYKDADKLVMVMETDERRSGNGGFSYPRFADLQQQQKVFDGIAAYTDRDISLVAQVEPESIHAAHVSANFFNVLGASPALGRAFTNEEDQPGGNQVAILGYELWQRNFGADPQIIGKNVKVDGQSLTVIGVMPARFKFLDESIELWMPRVFETSVFRAESIRRGATFLAVIGRLKSDVTLSQAQASMDVIDSRYRQEYRSNSDVINFVTLRPLGEQFVSGARPTLLVLLGAVGCVLLIACANVASLLLVRAGARNKEIAIRAALGATRWRLIRQALTESILLAGLGGALGLLITFWSVDALVAVVNPENIPRIAETHVDTTVLVFTLLISLLTGVLFGLVPALLTSKVNLNESLKEGGKGASKGARRAWAHSVLVIGEVSLSFVLLVCAGLFIRSFMRLHTVSTGLDPHGVLTMKVALPKSRYSDQTRQAAFYDEVLQRVGNLPGVQAVAAASRVHLDEVGTGYMFNVEGTPNLGPQNPHARLRIISPDYLHALNIPLVNGRAFTERDAPTSTPVMLINESMARRFFPDQNPVGKHITYSTDRVTCEIIGVVKDAKSSVLDAQANTEMYVPYKQKPWLTMTLVVRSSVAEPLQLADAVRAQIQAVDKEQPVTNIKTMERIVNDSVGQPRLTMWLVGVFAALSLLLAVIGIYGVISYSVAQRTHEIGIRIALGAQHGDVLKLIVGQGLMLILVGVTCGFLTALAATRIIAGLLYGVSATDPVVFAGIPILLTGVALLACYIPARRAMKVDPMVALRHE